MLIRDSLADTVFNCVVITKCEKPAEVIVLMVHQWEMAETYNKRYT